MSALVGLLYTATSEKLNFRVTSSRFAAQEAEAAWRNVLMTLRTVSGELPVAEDPTRPNPNPTTNNSGSAKPVLVLKPGDGMEPVRTKNVAQISRLGAQLNVFLPDGWKLDEKDDKITLTNPDVKSGVNLTLTSATKAELEAALRTAEKESFPRFNVVTLREGVSLKTMKSGSPVSDALRVGQTKEGAYLVVWHILGNAESVVWRADYECGSEAQFKKERKAIERLRDLLVVEIAK
jgi:hypothetical protein